MKPELEKLCNDFISGRDAVKAAFRWENDALHSVCAGVFCARETGGRFLRLICPSDTIKTRGVSPAGLLFFPYSPFTFSSSVIFSPPVSGIARYSVFGISFTEVILQAVIFGHPLVSGIVPVRFSP